MKIVLTTFILLLVGCATAPIESIYDRTYFVCNSSTSELKSVVMPDGFKVSPKQAYEIATKGRMQKIRWSIYADRKNYYLLKDDHFVISTSARARMYGVRVNGVTGKSDETMEQ